MFIQELKRKIRKFAEKICEPEFEKLRNEIDQAEKKYDFKMKILKGTYLNLNRKYEALKKKLKETE